MSIVFVVANKNKNSDVSIVGSKYFTDSTINISHSFQNSVTEHPVEQGTSFSDHVQVRNNRFTVNGVFGDFSLNRYAGDSLQYSVGRVKEAYNFLKKLRDDRSVFTLISKYDSYENCVIESLEIPVDVESSNSLYFNMSLVQIRTAATELVNLVKVDNVIDSKKDDAANTSNGGKKDKVRSVAAEATDAGRSLLNEALRGSSGLPTGGTP